MTSDSPRDESGNDDLPSSAAHTSDATAQPTPAVGGGAARSGGRSPDAGFERPGDFVGSYKLMSVLGEGGFGTVWLAERREPMVQRVALKIIKPGMDSKSVIARFEQERQALAVMDHPNVARVFDGGVTERGRPYFVMEHVQGEPITTFCDRHTYTIRQRLELFIPVCEAVQHAHMKGIIHRDIKPSNVLVSIKDGSAIVKVIDFGIAKAISHTMTDKTIFTETGQLIGTPEYMSPEQAEMGAVDIDTRTDVYSLGVVLYELLVGALPFDAKELRARGYAEIQRVIREVEPPTPSKRLTTIDDRSGADIARKRQEERQSLAKLLRSELEWIPLKAMRKDRRERYRGPDDLADDVRAFLEGRALAAGPVSAGYRIRKYVSRNRGPVVAIASLFLALSLGIAGTTWQMQRANQKAEEATRAVDRERLALANEMRAREVAEAATRAERGAREQSERNLYVAHIRIATEAMKDENWERLSKHLDACPTHLRGWEWGWLRSQMDQSVRTIIGGPGSLTRAVLSRSGDTLATASSDGSLTIWSVSTGVKLSGFQGPPEGCSAMDYSADGSCVAASWHDSSVISLFRTHDWKEVCQLVGHDSQITCIDISADMTRVVTASQDNTVRMWDIVTGDQVAVLVGHTDGVMTCEISADNTLIVTASGDNTVRLWDAATGECLRVFDLSTPVETAALSPDGSRVTAGCETSLCVWNVEDGRVVLCKRFPGLDGPVSVAFDTIYDRVHATFHDGTIRTYCGQSGDLLVVRADHASSMDGRPPRQSLPSHQVRTPRDVILAFQSDQGHKVSSVSQTGNGDMLASVSQDGTAMIWDAKAAQVTARHRVRLALGVGSFTSHAILACSQDIATIFDIVTGSALARMRTESKILAAAIIGSDESVCATYDYGGLLRMWDLLSVEQTHQYRPPIQMPMPSPESAAFAGVGVAAFADTDGVRIWNSNSGRIVADLARRNDYDSVLCLAFSPRGDRVVTGSLDNTCRIWDAQSGDLLANLRGHSSVIQRVAFSADGELVITASADRTAKVWNATTGEMILDLQGHSGQVSSAAFSQDRTRVVTASEAVAVIWDAHTGDHLLDLHVGSGIMRAAFISSDTQIVTETLDGSLRVYDSLPYRERYPKIKESREADEKMRPLVIARIAAGENARDVRVSMLSDPALSERERAAVMWITTEHME